MNKYNSFIKSLGVLQTSRNQSLHQFSIYPTTLNKAHINLTYKLLNVSYTKRSLYVISNYKNIDRKNTLYHNKCLLNIIGRYNSTNNKNSLKPDSVLTPPPETLYRKFRNIIDVFWFGCKALFTDVRLAVKTRRKLGLYHKHDLSRLTREELRHMRQTKKDLVKTFPVTLLFMVPFIGYSAPLLAYFYPKQLLSQQFWHPDQKKEFILEEYEKRKQYYQPLVKEVGITAKEILNKELLKFCYKTIDGERPSNDELLQFQQVFSKHPEFSLQKMPRYHLVKLCRCWLIPTAWYLPRLFLSNSLRRRVAHLQEDDLLIQRDGIASLTPKCIEHAVHFRGLDEASLNDVSKKYWLIEWVDLSTQVTSDDVSFLAHAAVFKAANFDTFEKDRLIVKV